MSINTIDEILKKQGDNTSIFKQYMDKEIIGANILKSLISKCGKNGFYLSDSSRNMVGVLTRGQGLLSLMTVRDFGTKLFDNIGLIFKTYNDILDSIHQNGKYVFDTSPYIENYTREADSDNADTNYKCDSYIPTLSILCKAFIKLRSYVIVKITENRGEEIPIDSVHYSNVQELLARLEEDLEIVISKLVNQCLKLYVPFDYMIDGNLIYDRNNSAKCIFAGWSFDKVSDDAMRDTDVSLYFTYMATEAYISIFSNLQEQIQTHRKNRSGIAVDSTVKITVKQNYDNVFFSKIATLFDQFGKCCYDAGHYIDMRVRESKIDLATEFINNEISKVNKVEIEASTTNDALFNTLFAVNIMVNAGVDLDYDSIGQSAIFYETIQYCIQNINRCYKQLKKQGKEFIVDDFILSFNERMSPELHVMAKYLRKQRIQSLSLLPLLITTHTTASKYLIRYPQKIMQEHLGIIMDNRLVTKRGAQWCWSSDEYNINVNFLYINALYDFYGYYEEFELPFTNDEARFNLKVDSVKEEYDNIIKTYKQVVKDRDKELVCRDTKITELLNAKAPLVQEVELLVCKKLDETMTDYIDGYFKNLYAVNIEESPEEGTMAYLFKRSFMSLFHDTIIGSVNTDLAAVDENGFIDIRDSKIKESSAYINAEEKVFKNLKKVIVESLSRKR